MSARSDLFWKEWAEIGKELLDYGEQIQYGNSLLEVKFMKGDPAVIVLSKSIKTKYPDNQSAKLSVGQILEDSETKQFTGSRTFTVAYNHGDITQILLDQYGNTLIN